MENKYLELVKMYCKKHGWFNTETEEFTEQGLMLIEFAMWLERREQKEKKIN